MSDTLGVPSYRSPDGALPVTNVRRLFPGVARAQLPLAVIFLCAHLRARWAPSTCSAHSARVVSSWHIVAVSAFVALVILWLTCAAASVLTVRWLRRQPSTQRTTPQETRPSWVAAWILLGLPLLVAFIYVATLPVCSVVVICE
jgi:hypothetical protein